METKTPLTVVDLLEEMKASQGFIIFVSMLVKRPDGTMELEHRYMRQQFVPEDLDKAFQSCKGMMENDIAESGMNLAKAQKAVSESKLETEGK